MRFAVAALLFVVGVASARQIYNDQVYEDTPVVNSHVAQIQDLKETFAPSGGYSYGYRTTDGQQFSEQGTLKLNDEGSDHYIVKQGSYGYTAPDGVVKYITYTADETGFHPVGDHIPKDNH